MSSLATRKLPHNAPQRAMRAVARRYSAAIKRRGRQATTPPRCGGRNRRYTIHSATGRNGHKAPRETSNLRGAFSFLKYAESLEYDTRFDTYALDRIKPVLLSCVACLPPL